jgi:hypothetical protein
MSLFLTLLYKFKIIPIKVSTKLNVKYNKLCMKFMSNMYFPTLEKAILIKNNVHEKRVVFTNIKVSTKL